MDQSSVEMFTDKESVDFLKNDPKAIEFWSNTKKISEVKAADYDAIFVVGGHGPMIDLWQDKDLIKLTEEVCLSWTDAAEDDTDSSSTPPRSPSLLSATAQPLSSKSRLLLESRSTKGPR